MTPKKLTMEKHSGTEMSCGQSAADGWREREAKSGAFLHTNVSSSGRQGTIEKDVRDESRHVADARHDAGDHPPPKVGPVQGCGLVDDRANSVRLHDTPDEKGDARYWDYYRLQRKEMSARSSEWMSPNCRTRWSYRTHILWIGNQMAGSEMSQKRKKHMKSLVVVPEDAGK